MKVSRSREVECFRLAGYKGERIGWEWAWDQQTTDDRFPPGMLSACLEGTTVRFASCGEVSKVLVEAKSLAVEDRLQRASPAFFYFGKSRSVGIYIPNVTDNTTQLNDLVGN